MAAKKRKKSARAPLTREKVLQAALKIADGEGLDAVSMRNVARALKVEAMSLYNHVVSKEDILDGLVDLVASELEIPPRGGDWRAAMRSRALTAHAVLNRHGWATMLFISRLNIGPNIIRYNDATLSCLRDGGFSWPLADHAWTTLDAFTYGFTLQKRNFPIHPDEYAAAAAQYLPMIPPDVFPGMHGMASEIIAGRHDGLHHLELGLDLLLDGFERLKAKEALAPAAAGQIVTPPPA